MKPIQVVCAIIYKEKKILVAQRSKSMSLPLKWEFPGGKVQPNETHEQCLHRELKEELNIEVKIQKKMTSNTHDYGNFIITLIPFTAKYVSGEIKLTEHNAIKWVEKKDLPSLEWAPADFPILNQILNSNTFFDA